MRNVLLLLVACVLISACSKTKSERGLKYMPDMYQSPALKSQESYVMKHGDTLVEVPGMRVPPEGTVPRGFIPYDFANDADQGKKLINPLAPTADVLALGRDKYEQFCAVCHGKEGDATKGYVATKLLGVPNTNSDIVAGYNDGHIFWILTAGRLRMPNYRAQLTPEERWAVIHYVRALHAAGKGKDSIELQKDAPEFKPLPESRPEYDRTTWPEVTK